MIINLTGQREDLILSLLRSGKFSSVDEVVNEALRLVRQRYQEDSSQDVDQKTGRCEADMGEPMVRNRLSGLTYSESTTSRDRTSQQLENLRRLGRKLDAMPTADVADGLSNRDHDRILYGK